MPKLFSEYRECSGCGACRQICPKDAISLIETEYGFKVPQIDETKCINCGMCKKVCPIANRKNNLLNSDVIPLVLGMRHKDKKVLASSTSGGAFSSIVEVLKPDYVFGVVFDEKFKVKHIYKEGSSIEVFKGSKYVQSDTLNTFSECKMFLDDGKTVVYTGTPCQIAGLKMFLGKEYENLFTVDLICEGVSSQKMFDEFLKDLSSQFGEIKNIAFRSKKYNGWERSDLIVEFNCHARYKRTCQSKDTFYMNNMMFLGGARDSCYDCKFNQLARQGDFTIGDLWGWRDIVPQWNDNKGISLLMLNSDKAIALREKFDEVAEVIETTVESASLKNPNIVKTTTEPSCRKEYLSDVKKLDYSKLKAKYHNPRSELRRVLSKIKFILKG